MRDGGVGIVEGCWMTLCVLELSRGAGWCCVAKGNCVLHSVLCRFVVLSGKGSGREK